VSKGIKAFVHCIRSLKLFTNIYNNEVGYEVTDSILYGIVVAIVAFLHTKCHVDDTSYQEASST